MTRCIVKWVLPGSDRCALGHGAATGQQVGDTLPLDKVQRCLTEADVSRLQQMVSSALIDDRVVDHAVRLARATRRAVGLGNGAGTRGAIFMVVNV